MSMLSLLLFLLGVTQQRPFIPNCYSIQHIQYTHYIQQQKSCRVSHFWLLLNSVIFNCLNCGKEWKIGSKKSIGILMLSLFLETCNLQIEQGRICKEFVITLRHMTDMSHVTHVQVRNSGLFQRLFREQFIATGYEIRVTQGQGFTKLGDLNLEL